MTPELLDIQPRELKFTFELKKQSSCSIQLSNSSDQYVAFKVKTTSPKKYCVRPNTGVVLPKSKIVFTVTMQSPREAPPDLQCKDKFLIQSTIVPFGTTAEDIKPTLFTKENGRYIEENKLKVVLISPPHSPVLLPINGVSNQEQTYEAPIPKPEPIIKDQVSTGVENLPPSPDVQVPEDADATKYVDDLKMKLDKLESQLNEAEKTILRLREERSSMMQAKNMLEEELALAKKRSTVRKVQVGYPFLFVCFVALISMTLGYMKRT